jgi:hypothetical protein
LAVASILLVTLTWVQIGGGTSYSERVDERRAQYIAGVMRQIFESERERVLHEEREHSFLTHMGLTGGASQFLANQVYDIDTPVTAPADVDGFEESIPRSGVNFSALRAGRTSTTKEEPTDSAWLAGQGYLPVGHTTGLDPRAFGEAAGTPLPVNIYYGRIRPDALVAGLCKPSHSTVDSDGDGTTGSCKGHTYSHGARAGSNLGGTAVTIDPEFGYVPAATFRSVDAMGTQTTPQGLANPVNAGGLTGGACVVPFCWSQMIFPFLGYYGTEGTSDKVMVTDDTALALVVKTNFSASQIPNERILRRVAELLAPYGGYGLHTNHNSEVLDYYKCLPHITDIEGIRQTTCAAARQLYTPANNAIIGGGLAWRYLAEELPLRDAGQTLFAVGASGGDLTPQTATLPNSVALQIQGQIFMVGLFGRRNSAQHALEVASYDAIGQVGGAANLYFSGDTGLIDAPAKNAVVDGVMVENGADTDEVEGRNFGFVYARDVTIQGDLIIQSDAKIDGADNNAIAIPQAELELLNGAFFVGTPYEPDDLGAQKSPDIHVTGDQRGDAKIRLEFLGGVVR